MRDSVSARIRVTEANVYKCHSSVVKIGLPHDGNIKISKKVGIFLLKFKYGFLINLFGILKTLH